ncbi:hypothetical protein [Halobellus captivus]|uniref:hypothetical protein n=1 Tax=Halobellus captivus TaxID=2592614 RepID=UPI0011A2393A|nr:hypothetical protein [Halobellus captivus]
MVKRRKVLLGIGTSFALAGCSGDTETDTGDSQTNAQTEEPTDTSTPTKTSTETPTETATQEPTEASGSSYQVRITYQGEWSGAIGSEGSTRSVDGSGTRTFDIDGDPFIVSANAQKQDDSSRELMVQILQGGEVIAEESTSSEYGLAQVTSEDDVSSGGDSGGSSSSFSVRIEYSGEWQGSISTGGSSRSVDGSGSQTIEIDGSPDIISANAQKQDASSDTLIIQILENGEVVEETSTSAEYGVAQISHTSF